MRKETPNCERCLAKRGAGDRCTRRRKPGQRFCGTHCKSTPNGVINSEEEDIAGWEKRSVCIEDINGIPYFVDSDQNVYHPGDIVYRKNNPRCIGRLAEKDGIAFFQREKSYSELHER